MATSSPTVTNDDDNNNESLLSSILSEDNNCFDCLSLPLKLHEPSEIRRSFLKLSLKVHPDKNPSKLAKEAFQLLSIAFETLYDEETQRNHLQEVIREKQKEQAEKEQRKKNKNAAKKRKQQQDHWKKQQQQRKKKKAAQAPPAWRNKRWEDVVAELKRREQLEKNYVRRKSDERLEKKIKGLVWKAMKICRNLDERAGCPPTFVNGLWAPLFEQEVLRQPAAKQLPTGWERILVTSKENEAVTTIVYRNNQTGEESTTHPDPSIAALVNKAHTAEQTNEFRFETETRLFLGEIVKYFHDDHDYFDMDNDMTELEEEEQARDNPSSSTSNERGYDY